MIKNKDAETTVTGHHEFDYAFGQPNLYQLMCLKQKLFESKGLSEGFAQYQALVPLTGSSPLNERAIRSEYEYALEYAIFFHESAKAGTSFTHPAPTVLGQSNHAAVSGLTRCQYVACFSKARVRGRSAFIEVDDKLLIDCQGDEFSRLDDELEWDPVIFNAKHHRAWYIPSPDNNETIEIAEAFSLLGAHTDFFGHWMVEYLPKYIAAILTNKLSCHVPVLIDAHMPVSHRQSLQFLFAGKVQVIEVPAFTEVKVERLWVAPTLMYMPLHEKRNERFSAEAVTASPDRFATVIQEMRRLALKSASQPERCYQRILLARKSFRHRQLVNADRVEQVAIKNGFHVLYPEDYSFEEQAKLLLNAEYIIASEGSAVFLVFFSRPGTQLLILSHPLTDVLTEYNGIFGKNDINMTVLTGPITHFNSSTPHDSDYQISPKMLMDYLADWLPD